MIEREVGSVLRTAAADICIDYIAGSSEEAGAGRRGWCGWTHPVGEASLEQEWGMWDQADAAGNRGAATL